MKCNIKNDCELFYLNDFKDYDFYNKLSARDAVRTKVYNVLAGKQNALNNEEFGNTWNDINREIFRYVSLFTHRVYNQEHDDVKLEFDDLDVQPLSVNADLISALRPATIVFDADIVAELTCRVECADSDDREAVAAGIELNDDGKPSVERPWMNRELIVYPTEYDFGLYQLDDGLYKVFNFTDNDYGSLPDPIDFIDMNLFGKRLAEFFDDEGDRYIRVWDYVIESPYGFR